MLASGALLQWQQVFRYCVALHLFPAHRIAMYLKKFDIPLKNLL